MPILAPDAADLSTGKARAYAAVDEPPKKLVESPPTAVGCAVPL